jgi:ATP-dependent Lon protease
MCCGDTPENGAVMNVDHIKPRKRYPELALDIRWLQILCGACNHGKGKVSLTGNLGEVMKESATIAHEWVMAHHKELGIDPEMFEKNDINIHVPEGAIPKDGPSAGITMVTSIVSTYTGRKVRERIAMTGETTLRGRVMPVGGIKEKILAAKRAGIKELILSEDNRKDISEIKAEYIDGLTFHYVRTNEDVLRLALEEKK